MQGKHLEQLRTLAPRQPHYMDRGKVGRGVMVAAWNLIVPVAVMNRTWEEVLEEPPPEERPGDKQQEG